MGGGVFLYYMKEFNLYQFIFCTWVAIAPMGARAQHQTYEARTVNQYVQGKTILPAAADKKAYLPLLEKKRVAVLINQTSEVNGVSVLDILLAAKINVRKIFVPEHGFRGHEDAGADIFNSVDSATGLPVISLHGSSKKPKAEQLADIDVLVYDLQDVGARFYTYISTLEYCMEACGESGKEVMVLDRPNPNGFYVDGPVLQKEHKSFVGMQPVPVVYGMTAGEYANMLVGEQWIKHTEGLKLTVIKCVNYDHSKKYRLPVAPSPNLRTMEAVYAYPSICFFEGTALSLGRGTDKPFRQYGCPEFEGKFDYSFVPKSGYGAKKPLLEGQTCYGELVAPTEKEILKEINGQLEMKWVIKAWNFYPTKSKFFTSYFTTLAGTALLEKQIKEGISEKEIRKSWERDLNAFKLIRKKYLLYDDF